jgi:glucose-6-phosphate 1-dehydrogenase
MRLSKVKMKRGADLVALEDCTMVIFGGTGDLARRKLAPALFNLHTEGKLPAGFSMIGVGRKEKSSSVYRAELAEAISEYSYETWDEEAWAPLAERIDYLSADIEDSTAYPRIREYIAEHNKQRNPLCNELYYFAVSPHLFSSLAANLGAEKTEGKKSGAQGWRRVMIEKPFGSNLETASSLNKTLCASFNDQNIYRTDHYLGKEMLHNILVVRFINSVFEPLWNNAYIDNVQVTVAENEGIGSRGSYYDRTGAMRDMVQSHLLQMLAVVAMEPPGKSSLGEIISNKLKLISAIRLWPENELARSVVFGQYEGYNRERDVIGTSATETYVALKLAVDNARWQGVPFYLRTGKMLQEKQARVTIQFKKPVGHEVAAISTGLDIEKGNLLNLLTLKMQPNEGIAFQFNIKKPASVDEIVPATMDFCQQCAFQINSPEAYELLIADAIKGEKARFSSWEEIEKAWQLIDGIYECYGLSGLKSYPYKPGSWGPVEAEEMLSAQGLQWWA